MNRKNSTDQAWTKLSQLAAQAPSEAVEMSYGFATRAVAAWKADRRETTLAAFEWLTLRGFAVAMVIFAGSAAFGYGAVAEVIAGETSLVGGWLDMLPLPL